MLVAAGLLLRLCTQLLRLVRLRTRLGLPQILVVGDSRPANLNESPTFLRRLSPARAGLCFGYSPDLNRSLSRKGEGGLFRDRADEALFPTCADDAAAS